VTFRPAPCLNGVRIRVACGVWRVACGVWRVACACACACACGVEDKGIFASVSDRDELLHHCSIEPIHAISHPSSPFATSNGRMSHQGPIVHTEQAHTIIAPVRHHQPRAVAPELQATASGVRLPVCTASESTPKAAPGR
jgi:hypothetical protein